MLAAFVNEPANSKKMQDSLYSTPNVKCIRTRELHKMGETPASVEAVLTKGHQLDRLGQIARGAGRAIPFFGGQPLISCRGAVKQRGAYRVGDAGRTLSHEGR